MFLIIFYVLRFINQFFFCNFSNKRTEQTVVNTEQFGKVCWGSVRGSVVGRVCWGSVGGFVGSSSGGSIGGSVKGSVGGPLEGPLVGLLGGPLEVHWRVRSGACWGSNWGFVDGVRLGVSCV